MRIIHKDYKKNKFKAKIENLDDLWYLTYIIEKNDQLKSRTFRKIKLGSDDDRNTKVVKKPVYISIIVEKIEFSKYTNILRVSGLINQGPDDIPLGSHHTINLEVESIFSIQKTKFLKYQIEKLEESTKDSNSKILIVVHDREEAYFALLKKYGYELLSQERCSAQKKTDAKTEINDLFPIIKKTIEEYDKRHNFTNIVIASPGFWKEYVQKLLKDNKKIVYATCSSVGINGINEVMKRSEVQVVLQKQKFAEEIKKVEILLTEISKQGKAQYGIKEIKKVVDSGAVSELLITDDFIHKRRQDDTFEEIDKIMRKIETMEGTIHIISSEHEGGQKLDGLGGIAALLRYKMNY